MCGTCIARVCLHHFKGGFTKEAGWTSSHEGHKPWDAVTFIACDIFHSVLAVLLLVHFFLNSIAFGKSTSQRIYREQHTPKIGWKLHKYRLKHALHTLDDHFR